MRILDSTMAVELRNALLNAGNVHRPHCVAVTRAIHAKRPPAKIREVTIPPETVMHIIENAPEIAKQFAFA